MAAHEDEAEAEEEVEAVGVVEEEAHEKATMGHLAVKIRATFSATTARSLGIMQLNAQTQEKKGPMRTTSYKKTTNLLFC